ncbi:MAG: cell division protein ZapB, partial [Spirochaetaceae bacterium]
MLTVEQIKLLENRVLKAVEKISSLQEENQRLREGLSRYERRIEELEVLVHEFREGQQAIEDGVLSALKRLDILEDEIASDDVSAEIPPDRSPTDSVSEK